MDRKDVIVRSIEVGDQSAWAELWSGYNAFYGRSGTKALSPAISAATWRRLLDPAEPVFGLVAIRDDRILGLAHYILHLSTTVDGPVCYLQDLFVSEPARGSGVGQALIAAVGDAVSGLGVQRVYWQTHESNHAAMRLYDAVAVRSGFVVYVLPPREKSRPKEQKYASV